jgi:predicted transcriptional regulator
MISPHTAIMLNAFASPINVRIMNALVKCDALRMLDLESMLEIDHGLIYYHIRELINVGLIERAKSTYDGDINIGYKLTRKAYTVIDDVNKFTKEMDEFASSY